jgi:hypothetical protein
MRKKISILSLEFRTKETKKTLFCYVIFSNREKNSKKTSMNCRPWSSKINSRNSLNFSMRKSLKKNQGFLDYDSCYFLQYLYFFSSSYHFRLSIKVSMRKQQQQHCLYRHSFLSLLSSFINDALAKLSIMSKCANTSFKFFLPIHRNF